MPEGFSDNSIFCNHANEMPIECPCDIDCYCYVHGGCGNRKGIQKTQQQTPTPTPTFTPTPTPFASMSVSATIATNAQVPSVMTKRAYIARVELEYIVVADSKDAAKKLACRAFSNDSVHDSDFELGPLSHLPGIYEQLTDIVDHDGVGDMTVEEALHLPGGYKHGK